MKIILNKNKLHKIIHNEKNLCFVPTMGALHRGHISLFKKCISECDKIIVSIFVNKPQFNKKNDYIKYPRIIKNDINILKKLKVNYLYLPSIKDIYPKGQNKNIKIGPIGKKLCGKFRPGHFEAVIDVIDRFVRIIKPNKIYFGEKDMQQLRIIDQFINKNYKNIKVIACKTIREHNGVAYSSRNSLLSSIQKNIASKIYKLIRNSKRKLIEKKMTLRLIKNKIHKLGVTKIDYIKILDTDKLKSTYNKKTNCKIFIAYYLGKIRLIDNI